MVINDHSDIVKAVLERVDAIHDLGVNELAQVLRDVIVLSYGLSTLEHTNELCKDATLNIHDREKIKQMFGHMMTVVTCAAEDFDELTLKSEEPE